MSSSRSSRLTWLAGAAVLPTPALAAPLTPALVFLHATPGVKLIMLALTCSIVAAAVVCVRKLRSGPRLAGGSAYLSSLRAGGPLLGCLGAAWGVLNMSVGIANLPTPPPINVLAPGFAEAILLLGLGFLTGAVAVICNWAVEAKIDRVVLD